MNKVLLALVILALPAFAVEGSISRWKPTPGISEAQAYEIALSGFNNFLTYERDGQECGPSNTWSFEYGEANLASGRPAFAISGYATAPTDDCAIEIDYDCRTVISLAEDGSWKEAFTDCEPKGFEE